MVESTVGPKLDPLDGSGDGTAVVGAKLGAPLDRPDED